jgi:maltooligosyltrehalose trehalohydrolase
VWADDLHHHLRRRAAGDRDGYYEDYSGTIGDIVTTIRQGWFYTGQVSRHHGRPRGTDTAGIPRERMVVCLQNHDQIGNRPFGRRLHHQVDLSTFRALSALLLFLPETPLLFMGQEWAATTRFMFFTDHHAALGPLVTEGRRAEFSRFEAFADPAIRAGIPDPQAEATFEDSRLRWDERTSAPHAGVLELYRRLLRLRRTEPGLRGGGCEIVEGDEASLAVMRGTRETDALLLVVSLGDGVRHVDLSSWRETRVPRQWTTVLTTEDRGFVESQALDGTSVPTMNSDRHPGVTFRRPAAIILKGRLTGADSRG